MNTRKASLNATRRGNTIVLVVGILVLLVIIATSFVTRTHAGRVTAVSTTRVSLRDDSAEALARSLAAEIADALFVRPVDPSLDPQTGNDSNRPRGPVLPGAVRYGVDLSRFDPGPDALPGTADDVLRFPYNFAPYQVVPWTNWPDPLTLVDAPYWPKGPGNPNGGGINTNLTMDGNTAGNPGFGDTRWLSALEPLRWDGFGNDGVLDAFSHWTHLSYIARPNNGYLLCRDISDITDFNNDGIGGVLLDHSIPVEQWLPIRPLGLTGATGNPVYLPSFINHWSAWLSPGYRDLYWDNSGASLGPPPNFWDLSDLDANGTSGEIGERVEDEFIPGTARWNVCRVLADTDGDGFTDAFWFLVPGTIEGGIRQIVAVRIIDNSAMLNVNVATRLVATDPAAIGAPRTATVGAVPAELALAGDLDDPAYSSGALSVGMFDDPAHWEINFPVAGLAPDHPDSPFGSTVIAWLPDRWDNDGPYSFLAQIGVEGNQRFPSQQQGGVPLYESGERLLYWNLAGRRPLTALEGLTPFDLADELELRMFHGNNYPWVFTRLERAINTTGTLFGLLHSTNNQALVGQPQIRHESSEYLDQLVNRELFFDCRHRLTTYSAARNDIMPPWLWPSLFPLDLDGNGFIDAAELHQFRATTRKLDLRRPVINGFGVPEPDVDRDGIPNEIRAPSDLVQWDDDVNDDGVIDAADHYALIAERVLRCLTDGTAAAGNGYFGTYAGATDFKFKSLRRAAAGLAANVAQYRDEDTDLNLSDAVRVETVRLPGEAAAPPTPDTRMLGLEPQPFLTEVLIGHLYASQLVPPGYANSVPPTRVVHDAFPHTAVVVVQIANPFDRPIDLSSFKLRAFGNSTPAYFGANSSLGSGEARTFYAVNGAVPGASALIGSIGLETLGEVVSVNWPNDRSSYDSGNAQEAVELVRTIGGVDVLVDRIDNFGDTGVGWGTNQTPVGEAVVALDDDVPPTMHDPIPLPNQDPLEIHPGLVMNGGDTHWIQWVHANRAWWQDFNADGIPDPEERNPRFIFADRDVVTGSDSFETTGTGGSPLTLTEYFDTRAKNCTTCPPRGFTLQMLDKGAREATLGSINIPDYPDEHEGIVQVGELLNVWMFGHELAFTGASYARTGTTFSEFMAAGTMTGGDRHVNRLRAEPVTVQAAEIGAVVGGETPNTLADNRHAVPDLPAGLRVLEAFVCDGAAPSNQLYGLAQEYTGRGTPGLINITGAPPEVLRSLPYMTRLVRQNTPPDQNPFVRVSEAMVQYRERFNGDDPVGSPSATGWPGGPDYSTRGDTGPAVRRERGFASIGELLLLDRGAVSAVPDPLEPQDNWRIDFPARLPLVHGTGGTELSTDITDSFDANTGTYVPDQVAGDVEEENVLFAGLSNLVTTRSDTFTVYFRVRSFRQNPSGVWDATDPEHIIDDSRYVMLVDRSEVERPYQQPKILYLEKLPR